MNNNIVITVNQVSLSDMLFDVEDIQAAMQAYLNEYKTKVQKEYPGYFVTIELGNADELIMNDETMPHDSDEYGEIMVLTQCDLVENMEWLP